MVEASLQVTAETHGIRCDNCGGRFPLATLSPGSRCAYCGAPLRLEGPAVQAARQYRDDFFGEMRRADHEHAQASRWETWHGQGARPLAWIGLVALVAAAPVLQIVAGMVAHVAPLPPEVAELLQGLSATCGAVVMFGAAGAYLFWLNRRSRVGPARVATAPGAPSRVACPHCGAPSELGLGQHVQTCSHCAGALIPGQTVMSAGLDAARLAHRAARLQRFSAERRGMLGIHRTTAGYRHLMPLAYAIPFVPMVLSALVVPLSAARGSGLAMVCVSAGVLLILGVGAVGGVRWLSGGRRKRLALQGALRDLARQFGGGASDQLEDLVRWLDASWAGPYEARYVGGGPGLAMAFASAWGYPVAVVLNLEDGGRYAQCPPYVRVLLAAWVPSASDGGPPPPPGPEALQTIEWLRAEGFLVSCEEGGILAMAQDPLIHRLREHPGGARQLATVVGHLARLAYEVGARPVAPASGS